MTPSKTHPLFGIMLAGFGALVLTPDALFIRLSGMDVWNMLVWRGLQLGLIMYAVILITSWHEKGIIFKKALSWRGIGVSLCQFTSNLAFIVGIAETSVSVILFALATSPIFGAYFSRLILKERTHLSTWLATIFTLFGIFITVMDAGSSHAAPDGSVIFGALCGLTAAGAIGLNFVLLRKHDDLPIPAIIGNGSLLSGILGLLIVGPSTLFEGNWVMISICGLIILPVSFYCLTSASRYTAAANIGLLMLLETILGPIWVWIGVGEAPTTQMMIGGMIVVVTLAIYVIYSSMRLSRNA